VARRDQELPPPIWRRWGLFIVAVIAVIALGVVDDRLKASPQSGFCPADPEWTVHAADFGTFWSALESTDAFERLTDEVPHPFQEFERQVYYRTGIRPTGQRWRAWLGREFLAAKTDAGFGVCVKPGILLRIVHGARGLFVSGDSGVYTFADLHYGWRNGYLIISRQEAYVRAALDVPQPDYVTRTTATRDIRFQWYGEGGGAIRLSAEDTLPVSGRIEVAITKRDAELFSNAAWYAPPALVLSVTDPNDLRTLFDAIRPGLEHLPGVARWERHLIALIARWDIPSLPRDWDADIDQTTVAVTDISIEHGLPIPEAALALRDISVARREHPLGSLAALSAPYPYEWEDREGTVTPILNDALALCLVGRDDYWYAATQERNVAGLLLNAEWIEGLKADVALNIDWRVSGSIVERGLYDLARAGALFYTDRQTVDYLYMPWVRAVKDLGNLHIVGTTERGTLRFEGALAEGVTEADDGS